MNLRKGSKVWVEDKDLAWVAAEVVSDSVGRHVQVLTATGKKVIIDFSYGSVVCFETMSFGFFILFLKFGVAFFFFLFNYFAGFGSAGEGVPQSYGRRGGAWRS